MNTRSARQFDAQLDVQLAVKRKAPGIFYLPRDGALSSLTGRYWWATSFIPEAHE